MWFLDMLYTKEVDENETQLPSPEQLSGYVIIKVSSYNQSSLNVTSLI